MANLHDLLLCMAALLHSRFAINGKLDEVPYIWSWIQKKFAEIAKLACAQLVE